VKKYKSVLGNIQDDDIVKGWNLVKEQMLHYNRDWGGVGALCRSILKNSPLAKEKAFLIAAGAALLIPPSSVPVEWSFSLMNLIETSIRNRMGEKRLNEHLHIKINTPDVLPPDFLQDAAMLYLAEERHGLKDFLLAGQEETLKLALKNMEKHRIIWEESESQKNKKREDRLLVEGYGRNESFLNTEVVVTEEEFRFHPPLNAMLDNDASDFSNKKQKRKRESDSNGEQGEMTGDGEKETLIKRRDKPKRKVMKSEAQKCLEE
jgi:hypothetical protein